MITVSKNVIDAPVMQIGCKYRFGAVFGSLQAGRCRVGTAQPLLLAVFQTRLNIL
jgi:hypothetical protein